MRKRLKKKITEDQMVLLAEKLKKAESEQVQIYPKYAFCRSHGCMYLIRAPKMAIRCGRGPGLCAFTAKDFHEYLRDHGMIREAE